MKNKVSNLRQKIFLSLVAIFSFNSFAYANEQDNKAIREVRLNTISLEGGAVFNSITNLTPLPILGLDYSRNISKNFSLGLGLKSTYFLANEVNINAKYFIDINEMNSFYAQLNLGGNRFAYDPKSYDRTDLFINPVLGYEFRTKEGFVWDINLNLPYFSIYKTTSGSAKEKYENDSINSLKGILGISTKIGYSF
ncbi:MAG: hypothetical protein U0457_12990 [Candidatus Sericytochromatia bacterium]